MVTYNKEDYAEQWRSLKVSDSRKSQIYRDAKKIIANKDKYKEIEEETGVPWYFIGVIHKRESDLDFTKHLHNGDPLTARTKHVPAGRPVDGEAPFTFLESAVDALRQKGYHKVTDWSPEHMAFMSERYNGFGYRFRGKPSPYLWSGSQHYNGGKFVSDGVYDDSHYDMQPGVMCILKAIFEIEKPQVLPELRKISRRLNVLTWFKNFFSWFFGLFAGVGTLDAFGVGRDYLDWIKSFGFTGSITALVIVVIIGWLALKYHEQASLREQEEGRYKPSGGPQ